MKKPMNKRQLQYQNTLIAIRQSVDELVAEVGFEKLRIKEVMARIGLAEGAFYHYFNSKNDLLFDRYFRGKQYAEQRYEEEWRHMDAIDALEDFVVFTTKHIKSMLGRLP